jgi:hypothetical protein
MYIVYEYLVHRLVFKVIKLITTVSLTTVSSWDRIGPHPEIKNAAGSYSEVLIYKIAFNHADKLWLSE